MINYVELIILVFSLLLIIDFLAFPFLIKKLKSLNIGQKIRKEGPASHIIKENTPTGGGIILVLNLLFVLLFLRFFLKPLFKEIWFLILAGILYGFAGLIDDLLSIFKKENAGLLGWQKLCIQFLLAGFLMIYLKAKIPYNLDFLFFKVEILPVLFWIFALVYITGFSNAFNLTDGVDGLLVTSSFPSFLSILFLALVFGYPNLVYVLIPVFVFLISFLWHNLHPAKIFMGDTGSMALGAIFAILAIYLKQEILFLVIGGLFVFETLSVTLQVLYFKITKGKRIFKMAPIHHHFELSGLSEPQIVGRFSIVSLLLAIFSMFLFIVVRF